MDLSNNSYPENACLVPEGSGYGSGESQALPCSFLCLMICVLETLIDLDTGSCLGQWIRSIAKWGLCKIMQLLVYILKNQSL